MKTLEQIMQEAEAKARLVAASDNPNVDPILQGVIDSFLKNEKKEKKKKQQKQAVQKEKYPIRRKPLERLDIDKVLAVYEKTGLKPWKTVYWFYENKKICPLIQADILSDDRAKATPIAAYTLMKRKELAESDNPPSFLNYGDLLKPSHKWTLGRISQVSGLDISYILGFRSGFDGNKPGHPNCSDPYHLGYKDGLSVRNTMIERGLIESDPEYDIYEDETDEKVLSELYRVRGYQRGT